MRSLIAIACFTFLSWPPFAACSQAQEEVPPVFANLEFDKALDQNKSDGKFLVVKSTASWCAPCKLMDRTTWRDEKVVAWFKANGVAIHFDVDAQKALAKQLDIQAMPTMIAFHKGEEFDRVVGYKDPTEFLGWLEGVKAGKKAIEAVRDRAQGAPKGTEEEVKARYDLAMELVRKSEFEKACEEYVWLWQNAAGSYAAVRTSFMASDIERLATKFPPAKERFLGFRDEITPRLLAEKVDRRDFDDWIVLNGVVGEPKKTLEWFDKYKADARWQPMLRSVSFRIEKLLMAEDRWADVAILYPDPVGTLQRSQERNKELAKYRAAQGTEPGRPDFEEFERERLRDEAGKLYAVSLAAGNPELAQRVVKQALEIEDSAAMRTALVSSALSAKQAREEHKAMLEAALKQGGDSMSLARLQEKLATALAEGGSR
jgi:thioredoxin 1